MGLGFYGLEVAVIDHNMLFLESVKVGSHLAINGDVWRYFLGDKFLVSVVNISFVKYRQVSLNIAKYCSIQISKVFDNYRQISPAFMTNSVEFRMLQNNNLKISFVESKISTKVVRTCSYRSLYRLYRKLVVFCRLAFIKASNFNPTII